MNLTKVERETVILFNEAEGTAQVETFNPRLLGQLRKVSACEGVSCREDQRDYGVYVIPKSMIKIHAPRQYSEKQKQTFAKNLKINSALF